jgi:predicted esterase
MSLWPTLLRYGLSIVPDHAKEHTYSILLVELESAAMGRILCLHGMGCNSTIFRWQLGKLIQAMKSEYEFVFLDGEVECEAAPGLENAPPPHLCFYTGTSVAEMAEAHEQIQFFIEEEGPFDGIIGFSQGAALAASYILHHASQHGFERPPFTFAFFLASTLPFSPDLSPSFDVMLRSLASQELEATNGVTPSPSVLSGSLIAPAENDGPWKLKSADGTPMTVRQLVNSSDRLEGLVFAALNDTENARAALTSLDADPSSENSCRPFHPLWTSARITMPTLHLIGRDDLFNRQARVLYDLCSINERAIVEHSGGHEVPKEERVLASLISQALHVVERSKLFASGVYF